MKRAKKLYILLGVLVLACIATFVLTRMEDEKEQIKASGETILSLDSSAVTSLSWRTTSYTEGYTTYVGSDYLIARLSGNVEIIAWSHG